MRNGFFRRPAPLVALLAPLFPLAAAADVGVDVSASDARDTYSGSNGGKAFVDWQKLSVTPWWSNDDWRVEAEVPWLRREVDANLVIGPLTVNGKNDHSNIGDSYVRSTRTWELDDYVAPYVTGELKLPTGSPDKQNGTVVVSSNNYSFGSHSSRGHFSFGNGSTDFRLSPGVTVSNDYAWATAEGGYIWSHPGSIPIKDRPAAYAGVGLTPLGWLEVSAEYDYEGATTDGGAPSKQFTYTLKLKPASRFTVSLSTYKLVDAPIAPGTNWTLEALLHF